MSEAEDIPESRHAGWTGLHRGRRQLVSGAAIVAIVGTCAASAPQAQTLTQALAEAYNTNPQLLAQRALLRATDEQVPQALSFWRPTVNFTGQVGYSTSSLETPGLGGRNSSRVHEILRPNTLNIQA